MNFVFVAPFKLLFETLLRRFHYYRLPGLIMCIVHKRYFAYTHNTCIMHNCVLHIVPPVPLWASNLVSPSAHCIVHIGSFHIISQVGTFAAYYHLSQLLSGWLLFCVKYIRARKFCGISALHMQFSFIKVIVLSVTFAQSLFYGHN